jgi:hypothetical protein
MNVFVTINAKVQFKAVAKDAAVPLIFVGKISPVINQGMGPNPTEKLAMNTIRQTMGIQPWNQITR